MPAPTTIEKFTLEDRNHKKGCPGNRIERYPATRPRSEDRPAKTVTVVRCCDCGGSEVFE